jgi:hypothetical protein
LLVFVGSDAEGAAELATASEEAGLINQPAPTPAAKVAIAIIPVFIIRLLSRKMTEDE